ncbi:hypothetical protein [Spirochaeta cellobiosiphila]|uniref:hypothetical protein n=1 Tax=Spirochaeta cellobiosiphila TaxID=504483 RepID=UPI00146CB4A3|nr:hypothetical protein [Spirochaeta cellobiosiphila]
MIKYSFINQIKYDYFSGVNSSVPVIFWVVMLLQRLLDPSHNQQVFIFLTTVLTAVCLILLLFRVNKFQSLAKRGMIKEAQLLGVSFYRGRGRVKFAFDHEGQQITAVHNIYRNSVTRSLKEATTIEVVFHPNKPKQAYLLIAIGEPIQPEVA